MKFGNKSKMMNLNQEYKMKPTTAPLTILKEHGVKELKNSKGEPYKMHTVDVKSSTKGITFKAVLFTPPNEMLELNKEKTFLIERSKFNSDEYVIKEKKDKTNKGFQRNPDLDIWAIALQSATTISIHKDVPSIMAVAKELVKQLKKEL